MSLGSDIYGVVHEKGEIICREGDPGDCMYIIQSGAVEISHTVYSYSNVDLPWPLNNRWHITKGLRDETRAAQHCYHSSWSLVTGNIRENSGEWILEPFGSAKTKATYRLCTDPGGVIPQFLVTQGTDTTMPQIIKAVRKRAANLLGQPLS